MKLHLKFTPSCAHHPGVLSPATDDMLEGAAFSHFTGSMMAIAFSRLPEITLIASIHGFEVVTTGSPEDHPDGCAE